MTSHDREFMNRIVNKIVEIDGGTLTSYSSEAAGFASASVINSGSLTVIALANLAQAVPRRVCRRGVRR